MALKHSRVSLAKFLVVPLTTFYKCSARLRCGSRATIFLFFFPFLRIRRSTLAGTFKQTGLLSREKRKGKSIITAHQKYRRQEAARIRGHNNKRARKWNLRQTNKREIESKQAAHRSAWPSIYYTIVACIIIRRRRCVWRMEHKGVANLH